MTEVPREFERAEWERAARQYEKRRVWLGLGVAVGVLAILFGALVPPLPPGLPAVQNLRGPLVVLGVIALLLGLFGGLVGTYAGYRARLAAHTSGGGRFCQHCGSPIASDAAFCPRCGTRAT